MAYVKQDFYEGQILTHEMLNHIEDNLGVLNHNNVVDLVMFMGQSNMAGRGTASQSIVCQPGHGYEFRAISDPTKLYNIIEPFGVNENNSSSGVTEKTKTGSLVSAFCEKYYELTQIPIVAVSCSKGGTNAAFWVPGGKPLNDAIARYKLAKTWLTNNNYTIRHHFMVWLQGESDGGQGVTTAEYETAMTDIVNAMMAEGIEKCFNIRVGNAKSNPTRHTQIIKAQTNLCKKNKDIIMVCTRLDKAEADGLMKDEYHLLQVGYNIVGTDAGTNAAFYVNNQIEPYMMDREYNTVYFPYNVNLSSSDVPTEDDPSGSVEEPVTIEFLFNENIENGLVFDEIGILDNGALTVTAEDIAYLEDNIVLSNDKDWTFECIALPNTTNGTIIASAGVATGGFIKLPSVDGSSTAGTLRLRDKNKTISVEGEFLQVYTEPTHFAITWSATNKEFKMYGNYAELKTSYSTGSADTFTSFSLTQLFGGYNSMYDFDGSVQYLRFTAGEALDVSKFHVE